MSRTLLSGADLATPSGAPASAMPTMWQGESSRPGKDV
eukprot:CAMPEP_0117561360 /NCGR_PEP_ID=MMETSP0784-20121206/54370_1 /TAXON_ID=39447 /ORGANISM="" /LENGTH=37 /DNA_ID= /DNA_START= /DNA_END= /DNA_ORIENTATION=